MTAAAEQQQDIDTKPPKVFLRTIEHDITDEENSLKKNDLVALELKIDSVKLDKQSRNSDFNAELKQLNNQRAALLGTIQTGREKREIECYEVPDERRGIMAILRADTKEVIDERALTLEERQGKFPFEERTPAHQSAEDDDSDEHPDTERPPAPDEDTTAAKKGGAGKVVRIKASDVKNKRAARAKKAAQAVESNGAGEDEGDQSA